ncbi:MAG: hypothetical protein IJ226_03795 [Clostridia bacterium]|nr:hypothetical protein [Clostridia bacterium]
MNRKSVKEYLSVEEEFFDIDKENKIAYLKLHFSSPNEIFDENSVTKMPIMSDDFTDWIKSSFELTPSRYKISLEVVFDDMCGYTGEQLQDIFVKNTLLDAKKYQHLISKQNKIAISLVGIGIISFVAMMLVTALWKDGGVAKEIFAYIADIATTVTFWEAMTILIVQNKERRSVEKSLTRRFASIEFKKIQKTDDANSDVC